MLLICSFNSAQFYVFAQQKLVLLLMILIVLRNAPY